MFKKMILVGLISMVPIIELRGAIPYAVLWDAQPLWLAILIAVIGNMIPVPFIYLFARKILVWGADKPVIGKFFSFCLEKGEKVIPPTIGGYYEKRYCQKGHRPCGGCAVSYRTSAGHLQRN